MERETPQAHETERALLSSVLIDPSIIYQVMTTVTPTDFYNVSYKWIYEAILGLAQDGAHIDPVTVAEYLRQRGQLKELTSAGDELAAQFFVSDLIKTDAYSFNWHRYCDDIKAAAQRRRLIEYASLVANTAYNEALPIEHALQTAEHGLMGIRESDPAKDRLYSPEQYTDDFVDWLDGDGAVGISTGFADLDRCIGGLEKGNVYGFCAAEKMGKSSLLMAITRKVALFPSKPVVVRFSLEMDQRLMMRRDVSALTGISVTKLKSRDLTDVEKQEAYKAVGRIRETNLIYETTAGITPSLIRAKLNQVLMRYGRIDLVAIDYFQIMDSDDRANNENEKHLRVSAGVTRIAKEFDIPVILAAQVLSKSIDHRADQRPVLSDVRGSSALQSDCYFLAFLYRDHYYNPDLSLPSDAELIVRAHRDGPTPIIPLYFNGECTTFENSQRGAL